MKHNTIKWRIFKYNIIAIVILILTTSLIFNVAVQVYVKNKTTAGLKSIISSAEAITLERGPDFFPQVGGKGSTPMGRGGAGMGAESDNGLFRFYYMLDRSLKEPLSMLNAEYVLLDGSGEVVASPGEDYIQPADEIVTIMKSHALAHKNVAGESYFSFHASGGEFTAVMKPVGEKNSFGLGWIIIYASLQNINQLQFQINLLLIAVLVLSAMIISLFSSITAKKISEPFTTLNQHIGIMAERKFGTRLQIPVDDEFQDFVNNINALSEKLEAYDKAQKTFLQNVSHEFRTPLMSIQSYAEGIEYDVVDGKSAAGVILDETRRLTRLVEDVLYLSRLDAIEESYQWERIGIYGFGGSCMERMRGIAAKAGVSLLVDAGDVDPFHGEVLVRADEEKLSRAFTNMIGNCIRYAGSEVAMTIRMKNPNEVQVHISDDGPGIGAEELPHIFERFYKGKKGNFGLGLAISKTIIEKHGGGLTAQNSDKGAVFTITLPVSTDHSGNGASANNPNAMGKNTGTK